MPWRRHHPLATCGRQERAAQVISRAVQSASANSVSGADCCMRRCSPGCRWAAASSAAQRLRLRGGSVGVDANAVPVAGMPPLPCPAPRRGRDDQVQPASSRPGCQGVPIPLLDRDEADRPRCKQHGTFATSTRRNGTISSRATPPPGQRAQDRRPCAQPGLPEPQLPPQVSQPAPRDILANFISCRRACG